MSAWFRLLFATRSGTVALVVFAAIALAAIAAPWIAPQNPYDLAALDLRDSRLPPGSVGPSGHVFALGSDVLGRDVLAAILYGLRMSLAVGVTSSMIALSIGMLLGLYAAYRGGRVDALLMRLVDLQLSFPTILVALILLAVLGKGLDKIVLALVLVQWAMFARTARAAALSEVRKDYVDAARILRLPQWRIVLVHLLPNCLPPVSAVATVQVAHAISLEATMSFLGVGLPITEPSLGLLIASGFQYLLSGDYWISIFPGIALLLLVGSLNVVADGLRAAMNPRLKSARAKLPPLMEQQRPSAPAPDTVLTVDGVSTRYTTSQGIVNALNDVSLSLRRGEILGLVGESGSGKSVLGRSIMGLVAPPGRIVAGDIWLGTTSLRSLTQEERRALRGNRIAMVLQDPLTSLNPVLRIETQLVETILAHEKVSREEARSRALKALEAVGIPAPAERLKCYPHQLSGGMRQRVAIAIALLNRPDVVIADEPTTALDVTIQSQILAQVQTLARETGTALIWITHDLGVVAGLADRIAVMYLGHIVETGPTREILQAPAHPYTAGLIASIPSRNERGKTLQQLRGTTPSPIDLPTGCVFRNRCERASERCAEPPQLRGTARQVRCFHPLQEVT
jgi:peptide/nickel transport system permease protein